MENYKITDSELNSGVIAAPDTLVDTPQNNKMVFDRLPKLIATKFNGFVDSVIAKFTGYYTKEEVDGKETALVESIDTKADANNVYTKAETYTKTEVDTKETALGKRIDTKANSNDVYAKTETYTKAETDKAIKDRVTDIGAGDMAKAVYDTNNNGVVDNAENANNANNAEKLGGQLPEYYATATAVQTAIEQSITTYTQSSATLTGSGANGKFKATATGTYTAFTIGGVSYAVKAGSETEIELTSGVWYSFILDTGAKTINFKAGGAGLNFKIVGGTTQPTSPKENTIWVNTNTAIGEYQFSATQPTKRTDGTALQSGDLWVEITPLKQNVKFNALKKNSIELYCVKVLQYNGTSWNIKTANIYQDSSWKTIDQTIWIIDGDCKIVYGSFAQTNATTPYISNNFLMFECVATSGDKKSYWVNTTALDVTNYKTLQIEYGRLYATKGGYELPSERYVRIGLYTSTTANESFTVQNYIKAETNAVSGTINLDVTNLKGNHYLKLYMWTHANENRATYMYAGYRNVRLIP